MLLSFRLIKLNSHKRAQSHASSLCKCHFQPTTFHCQVNHPLTTGKCNSECRGCSCFIFYGHAPSRVGSLVGDWRDGRRLVTRFVILSGARNPSVYDNWKCIVFGIVRFCVRLPTKPSRHKKTSSLYTCWFQMHHIERAGALAGPLHSPTLAQTHRKTMLWVYFQSEW